MSDERPQGRKRNIKGTGSGLNRRGEGQNTGPVGSTGNKPGQDSGHQAPQSGPGPGQNNGRQTFTETQTTGSYGGKRSTGRSPLLIIIVIAILYFALRNGGLTGLLGGSGVEYPSSGDTVIVQTTPKPTATPQPAQTSSGLGAAIQQALMNSSTMDDWKEPANVQSVNTAVAAAARDKYTVIRGGGKDTVTVMVYMIGTDLESSGGMATKDLLEMTRATIGEKVNVIVYTGGCSRWNNNVVSNRTNQIYQVVSGSLKSLNNNAGAVSMVSPDTLASFISYCSKNFKADRYELILWDHGGGSISGFGHDQKFSSSGSMTLAGIKQALEKGGVKFDFIGFDACLMATLENALMLDPYADYLIASEETEPGTGWYYTNWLTKLSSNTSLSTVELGRMIVDDFVSACAQGAQGQSATLSVVDLAELSATVPAPFRAFSQSISEMIADNDYKQISVARSNTREFARSTAIDQIDLVHFASNLGTAEGKALSDAVLGAVKYNRTSSNMNNAYGLSVYFPYRKMSNVDKAIKTYSAIGMDDSYSQCIRDFAGLQSSGQIATGGSSTSPYSSLFGDLSQYGLYGSYGSSSGSGYGSSSGSYSYSDSYELIGSLLESFLGSSSSGSDYLFGRSMNTEDTAAYIAGNLFDPTALKWTKNASGEYVISLSEEQWSLVTELDLCVFYDDGQGYIDLGLDNVFEFDDNGDLLAPEMAWLCLNGQIVPYYREYTTGRGSAQVSTGYIPVRLNGERAELLVVLDSEGEGSIAGVRMVYADGETETVAKSLTEAGEEVDLKNPGAVPAEESVRTLRSGDTLEFLCDCYRYDGSYEDSFLLGEPMVVKGECEIYDAYLPEGSYLVLYRFTDIYGQHYWSLPLPVG